MNVLLVVHDYLPQHLGGCEIHTQELALELLARGHTVHVLCTERDLSATEGSLRRGVREGVAVIELVHQREYADVSQTWEQPLALATFEQVLEELRPDVVHFQHLACWGPACLSSARERGAATVLTLHDYFLWCDNGFLLREDGGPCRGPADGSCSDCLRRHPLSPELWPQTGAEREDLHALAARRRFSFTKRHLLAAQRILVPSRALHEHLCASPLSDPEIRARAEILRTGYPGVLHPPRRAPRRPMRAGFVGGIYFAKGVHVALAALALLREKPVEVRIPVELRIHGVLEWFPDYVERLRAAAAGLPASFCGAFEPRRRDEIFAGLDVLVVPSIWPENMPLVVQEAFRNGIPVVASDVGGLSECVEHGVSGLLVPPGDPRSLADALAALAADHELYQRLAAGRPQVVSMREVVDRLERVYASCR
jgi:glycosyltransferase involved in cell wall biosynthesis